MHVNPPVRQCPPSYCEQNVVSLCEPKARTPHAVRDDQTCIMTRRLFSRKLLPTSCRVRGKPPYRLLSSAIFCKGTDCMYGTLNAITLYSRFRDRLWSCIVLWSFIIVIEVEECATCLLPSAPSMPRACHVRHWRTDVVFCLSFPVAP